MFQTRDNDGRLHLSWLGPLEFNQVSSHCAAHEIDLLIVEPDRRTLRPAVRHRNDKQRKSDDIPSSGIPCPLCGAGMTVLTVWDTGIVDVECPKCGHQQPQRQLA